MFVIPTSEGAVTSALESAAPGGTVVFYSPIAPDKVWHLAPSRPYFLDLTLTFSYSSGPSETRRAMELIRLGLVSAKTFVTHRLPLVEAGRAFQMAASGGDVLKVMIRM